MVPLILKYCYFDKCLCKAHDGIVSGVLDRGIYVELNESKCEGLIKLGTLEGKWIAYPDNYFVTSDLGDKIRLGDPIKVVVKSVDLEKKQIDFLRF